MGKGLCEVFPPGARTHLHSQRMLPNQRYNAAVLLHGRLLPIVPFDLPKKELTGVPVPTPKGDRRLWESHSALSLYLFQSLRLSGLSLVSSPLVSVCPRGGDPFGWGSILIPQPMRTSFFPLGRGLDIFFDPVF